MNIYRSATGRVVGSIRPPKPYHAFVAVSRLGGDRTFVAAAITAFSHAACTSHLFRFSIDGQGHPSGLTSLSVPQVTGQLMELVSSADGKALAFTVSGCVPTQEAGIISKAGGRDIAVEDSGRGSGFPIFMGPRRSRCRRGAPGQLRRA